MVKVTLEKSDIENLIKAKYSKAEIISGLDDDTEIVIRVEELQVQPPTNQPPPKEVVRLDDGTIDAAKSGLALENREQTVPGGSMGRGRGHLPTF